MNRFRLVLAVTAYLFCGCAAHKPVISGKDLQITLPPKLQTGKMEFSSMAWYGSELLLVPQYPDRFGDVLFALNSTDLDAAILSGKAIGKADTVRLLNLAAVKERVGNTYEGFEATAVAGNRIFFSIETKSTNADCYLVSGRADGRVITLDPARMIALPKNKRLSNAGYESLAWLPGKNKLAAFFEYNKADSGPKAWLIDTTLVKNPESIALDALMFRLTDVTAIGNNKLLGINFHYNGRKEFGEYVGADSAMVIPALHGKTLSQTCYSRIIELDATAGRIVWKEKRTISLECSNWEGIAYYRGGVLIITDEYPASVLQWLKL